MQKLRKQWRGLLGGLFGAALAAGSALADYSGHPQAGAFVDEMVKEHGFKREQVVELLRNAERQQSVLDAISRPAEKAKPWKDYRKLFVASDRILQGAAFWKEHAATLARAEREYGVPASIIVAILGVETRYGRIKGSYRVLDALATLGFDYPPRSPFFRGELVHYLLMTREQGLPTGKLLGSYAGAMGYGQFIPSSYRNFAVDFSGDGVVDLVNNVEDAIGSIANYLKVHGWQTGQPIVVRATVPNPLPEGLLSEGLEAKTTVAEFRRRGVKLAAPAPADDAGATLFVLEGDRGPEYWLGLNNFYVITRYNRSQMYSLAVVQLADAVAAEWRKR